MVFAEAAPPRLILWIVKFELRWGSRGRDTWGRRPSEGWEAGHQGAGREEGPGAGEGACGPEAIGAGALRAGRGAAGTSGQERWALKAFFF